MVKPEVVARRILALNEALQDLQRPGAADAAILATDRVLRSAVERWLQVAIEACIDLAYHVASDEGWPAPANAREAFELLASHGLVPLDLAQRLGRATGMRNLLVHDYVAISIPVLASVVGSDLGDLRTFGAIVAAMLP